MSPAEKTFCFLAPDIRGFWIFVFALLAAIGAAAFLYGISGDLAARAWQAYLTNYVFWTGLSFGAVLFSAILNMAYAEWGRPVKRLAEAFGAYLPVSYLLFWVLYFGRETLFHWMHEAIPEKQAWLNIPFLFARNGVALLLLTGLSLALVYYSLRGDRQWLAEKDPSRGLSELGAGRKLENSEDPFSHHRFCVRFHSHPHGF